MRAASSRWLVLADEWRPDPEDWALGELRVELQGVLMIVVACVWVKERCGEVGAMAATALKE